jgi:valyl-tRNA synthetase
MQLEKVYEPQRFEPRWAEWWIEAGIFRADVNAPGPVFSLAIPPPNVTGSLHTGHMLEYSEIDTTIRWRRMCGDNTLWLPGADHADIATQLHVERQLASEGLNPLPADHVGKGRSISRNASAILYASRSIRRSKSSRPHERL